MSELPAGWAVAPVTELAHFVRGVTYKKSDARQSSEPGLVGVLRANNISNGRFDLSDIVYVPKRFVSPEQRLRSGDVVIATSSGSASVVGKAAQVRTPLDLSFGAFCGVLRPDAAIEPRYVGHYFQSQDYRSLASAAARGVNINNLKRSHFDSFLVSFPSRSAQVRIADKLDAVIAKIDACRDRLDRVPAILNRFREAVLEVAVSGKLTEEEIGSVELDEVAEVVDPHPSHRTPPEVATGVPYVGIGDIGPNGRIDFANARKVSHAVLDEHRERYTLREGDFVFGKIGTLGRATPLPTPQDYTISANVLLVKPRPSTVQSTYLRLVLSSPSVLRTIVDASSATSQAAFGIKKMRSLTVPLPPFARQSEIVRQVGELIALADQLEAKYRAAVSRVEKITPAVLAKAFRGELVEQDPGDEPAERLLERIRAQREVPAARPDMARKAGAGRKTGRGSSGGRQR